ncbi:transcriptional repressor [Variovorax sp. UMC13]|uniref:transcriptional repressor n=1 Tax=Variovorax sp. UMC13 TaxID=1862326 RepID=UPI00287B66B9|nr:transcriptional repressor [Variovorax sp. UMC13]
MRQRTVIRAVVTDSSLPLLPLAIQERAQHTVPGFGLATVYCDLKLLVKDWMFAWSNCLARRRDSKLPTTDTTIISSGARGSVFDVHQCLGDFAALAPRGFKVESHEITLYGLCADFGKGLAASPSKREKRRNTPRRSSHHMV